MNTNRALQSFEALFTAGPAYSEFACSCCREVVESVDSHGTCDDCAAARAARDEADELAANEADLAADEGFAAWCEARRDEAIEHQLAAEERPLAHRIAA